MLSKSIVPYMLAVFGVALLRSTINYGRALRKSFFRLPPAVLVQVVQTAQQCEEALRQLLATCVVDGVSRPIVGLDTEWRPHTKAERNKVAVLQLGNDRVCLVLQLHAFDAIPDALKDFLSDSSVLKVGVGIMHDAKLLLQDHGLAVRGCVDLQSLAYKHGYSDTGNSLASISLTVLGLRLNKSYQLQCSDWQVPVLSPTQIEYAALDAYAAHACVAEMYSRHADSSESVFHFCEVYVDRRPVIGPAAPGKVDKVARKKAHESTYSQRIPQRKGVLYENCRMVSPAGEVLCTCNKKKMQWYLDRNLADLISEDPPTIQLRFKPAGRGHADDAYYLGHKENRCVVCGSETNYVRHSVVPHSYRRWFDVTLKSRSSHDVVLMCVRCVSQATVFNSQLREEIAAETGIPLEGRGPKHFVDARVTALKQKASALISGKTTLPPARREEILVEMRAFLNKDVVTDDDVAAFLKTPSKVDNPDHVPHEQLVVATLTTPDAMFEFVRRWRHHFLRTMKPKFLSPHWDPDRALEFQLFKQRQALASSDGVSTDSVDAEPDDCDAVQAEDSPGSP
eukprot:TRINITY_DN2792_c0_g1_i1.p1 TRINITY_DN2792_c0_g1~~TRINITY_DN2792_c0_g1_i1.p1  ORF type:complete len:566 (+),score=153.51 TRINITY_DN2792_c0_g1_i1:979-2676(+)